MSLGLFYGNFMRGGTGHDNLAEATFVEEVRTAPRYRLFSVGDEYPGLAAAAQGGASIAGELYDVPDALWERILAVEPPELARGTAELADGRVVATMLLDLAAAGPRAREITAHGGWAAYLEKLRSR